MVDETQQSAEQTQTAEAPTQTAKADIAQGSKPETINLIDRADETRKRLEDINSKVEENIARLENLMARQALGGQAVVQREQTPQEDAEERAKQVVDKFF